MAKRRGRRDAIGWGFAFLNRLAGAKTIDRLGLRKTTEKAMYEGVKHGFRTVGAVNRSFTAAQKMSKPARPPKSGDSGMFDLTPTDEQQWLRESVQAFATEHIRPNAAEADENCAVSDELLKRSTELGLTLIGVPEELEGAGTERSTITNVLVAEDLAHGDMGLAVSLLAPAAVSNALVLWGDETQQATYLPSFVSDDSPAAALAITEPQPLFDPFVLKTRAKALPGGGYVLNGVKSLVPRAATAELFVIAADLEGSGPALFVVESGTKGIAIETEPSMGLRAASLGRLELDDVKLPASALLGGGTAETYAECIHLSRLGWCAVAVGTGQAVLDYVIPYVNDRVAFGEPISHRQSVAFMVANIAIELEGMRLLTYRAASRAEQGKPFFREAALARKLCADKGMTIGLDGVQLLGGHGFVKEHPVERWYRDLRAIGLAEGALLV